MKRLMVYLEPEQLASLRDEARQLDCSMAELLRRVVQRHIDGVRADGGPRREALMQIVGIGASGSDDVSAGHDRHLAEVLHDDHAR